MPPLQPAPDRRHDTTQIRVRGRERARDARRMAIEFLRHRRELNELDLALIDREGEADTED